MKKTFKRRATSILAAILISASTVPALANGININMPATIYENIEKNNLSSGVVHEKIMKFTTAGWWNINVLRVNLLDPYTEVKGLYNQDSVSKRTKVSTMVDKQNAVGGINADFFYTGDHIGSLGALIEEGDLVAIPKDAINEKLPGFFIDFLNQGHTLDLFRWKITLNNLSKGNSIDVNGVNSIHGDYNAVTMLNRHFGEKSIGNAKVTDLIEVFVVEDTVVDIRIGQESGIIPENGYVLVGNGEKGQALLNLSMGDEIGFNMTSNPDINNIKFAVGGGNIILNNGNYVNLDPNSSGSPTGAHPRTGIGISQDKTEIILVTIDGRDTSFKGVSQQMFGAILKDLGAYDAINFDGGGSTAMAIKPLDQEKSTLVNKPSDGSERAVINGVGVFSNAPVSELSYIKLSTDDRNMFLNSSRKFTVRGYDKYHNPVEVDNSQVVYSFEGAQGIIAENRFKALDRGSVKITAKYGELESSIDMTVLGNVKDISTSISSFNIGINNERALPIFYGIDENGNKAKIDSHDIDFTYVNNIGKVENNIFYSGENTVAGAISAKFGEGIRNILVYIGEDAILLEGFENLNNINFTSHPADSPILYSANEDAKEGKSSAKLAYDFTMGEGTRAAYMKFNTNNSSGLTIQNAPKKLGLWVNGDSNGGWLRATVKDSKGNQQKIDFARNVDWEGWKYLSVSLPNDLVFPIVLEDIYVAETDNLKRYSGSLSFDGLTAMYSPALGNIVLPTPSVFKDSKKINSPIDKGGFSFGVMVEPKNLNKLVQYDATKTVQDKVNKHKYTAFINGISGEFAKGLSSQSNINGYGGYRKVDQDGFTFINLNTEKGGIRATDSNQWNLLKSDLHNSESKNIVIMSNSPIFNPGGFTDTLEADLLHKYLVEAKSKGKNIYVVYAGNTNTSELKDGIRYVGFDSRPMAKADDIYNLSVVEFVVNGDNITYEINPIFPKPVIKVNQ